MYLTAQINAASQLVLGEQSISIEMSQHEGLVLLATLHSQLGISARNTEKTISSFYSNLLLSLNLLGNHQRQQILAEASLPALAALLRRFKQQPEAQFIRQNLSQRRLSQVEEEASYLATDLTPVEELVEILAPFYSKINEHLQQGELHLKDPKGIYFASN